MLDCWMSQDVNYATKLAHACAPYNLKWIEECLPPQQYEGYRELKRQAPADDGDQRRAPRHAAVLPHPVGNRHRYYAARRRWCGGLTTLVEIAAIAKARGQLVVPHARRFTHIMR